MKTIFKILLCFACLFVCSEALIAQSKSKVDFELTEVEPKEKVIRLYFKAINEDNRPIKISYTDLQVTETIEGGNATDLEVFPGHVKDTLITSTDSVKIEKFDATFLLDVSKGMSKDDLNKAKSLIRKVASKVIAGSNSQVDLITFDDEMSDPRSLTASNIDGILGGLNRSSTAPDFYNSIIQTIRNLKRKGKGKKILFVLSNGENETEGNSIYDLQIPFTEDDVIRQVEALGIDFHIFPSSFSEDAEDDFLKKIVNKSGADDSFQKRDLPSNWEDNISNNEIIKATRYVDVYTSKKVFRGETGTYQLKWKGESDEKTIEHKGTITSDSQQIALSEFGLYSFIGLLLVGTILGICSLVVPFIRNLNFKRNFVKPYVPESNRRRIDPITSEPIEAGELVVHKCQQLTPLSTWEGLGGQCPNYPDCMDFNNPCKGQGAPIGNDKFFSMNGEYRRLNWMWFGATGGLIAWTILYLFKLLNFDWYKNLFASFFTASILRNKSTIDNTALNNQLENLSNDTLAGAAFGLGLIFMLSWVEEKSQPRRISWGRVIFRTMIGMLISLLIFFGGFMLQFYDVLPKGYVGGLITWLFFGAAIGTVLSIQSSISFVRGVIGGLVSIAIAYHVYLLLGSSTSDFILGKLLSLILLGGTLGWILETVVTRLEDFELEYISPENFRNTVPISKWLKAGIDIFIGTDSGSYIYVKWDDGAVQPQHAKLLYDNGVVFIEPMAETLIKGRILPYNRRTALKNGDVIQLGRDSITRMRYKEKGRAILNGSANGTPPPPPPPVDDGKPKIRIRK